MSADTKSATDPEPLQVALAGNPNSGKSTIFNALAVLLAKVLRSTLFKGETAPFVMKLPPYRMPTFKGTLIHMWERASLFLRKAGTIIVLISIVLWAMNSYPKPPEMSAAMAHANHTHNMQSMDEAFEAQRALKYSISGRIGHALEPIMKPIGFDWKTSTAMVGAFAAKEVLVAQLGIVHAVGQADSESESLRAVLRREYTPLQAISMMLFCLISVPCMVTVVTTWKKPGPGNGPPCRWAV